LVAELPKPAISRRFGRLRLPQYGAGSEDGDGRSRLGLVDPVPLPELPGLLAASVSDLLVPLRSIMPQADIESARVPATIAIGNLFMLSSPLL
jgi:hypothetical protein